MHTQRVSSRNRACRLRGIPRRDQHAVLIKPKFPDQGQQGLGKLMELSCSSRGCHRQARVLARGPAGIAQAQPQLQDAAALPAAALPKLGSPGSCCVLGPHPSPLQQLLPLPSFNYTNLNKVPVFSPKADAVELKSLPCQVSVPVLSHLLLLLLKLPCMVKNVSM